MTGRPPLPLMLAAFVFALLLFWGYFGAGSAMLAGIAMLLAWNAGRFWPVTTPPSREPHADAD